MPTQLLTCRPQQSISTCQRFIVHALRRQRNHPGICLFKNTISVQGIPRSSDSRVSSVCRREDSLEKATKIAPLELSLRFLASGNLNSLEDWMVITAIVGAVLLAGPQSAEAAAAAQNSGVHSPVIGDLAEDTAFWSNVLRYVSYFFSVLLGTAYVALKPIVELMKRPTTAVLVILGTGALYFFVSTTVSAMLGLNDIIDYEPSSIVTPLK